MIIGRTATNSSEWIQWLGTSKTNQPMIHAVSSRPEENSSMRFRRVERQTATLCSARTPRLRNTAHGRGTCRGRHRPLARTESRTPSPSGLRACRTPGTALRRRDHPKCGQGCDSATYRCERLLLLVHVGEVRLAWLSPGRCNGIGQPDARGRDGNASPRAPEGKQSQGTTIVEPLLDSANLLPRCNHRNGEEQS